MHPVSGINQTALWFFWIGRADNQINPRSDSEAGSQAVVCDLEGAEGQVFVMKLLG